MDAISLNDGGSIETLLNHIIVNYLAQLYCVCILWNNLDSKQIANIRFDWNPMPENYPRMIWLKYEALNRNQTDDLVRLGIDNNCQAFITTPNSIIDFLNSFEDVRFTTKSRYHLMHVVVLPANHDTPDENINQIVNHPTVRDIPNILIISPSSAFTEKTSFNLVTTQFFGRNKNPNSLILDTFDTTRGVENKNLFPDKFSNLLGREIRVALFNYKPYDIWEEVEPGTGNVNAMNSSDEKTMQIDGTESILIVIFCQLYNCTLSVMQDDDEEWGAISDDMTGDGILGTIAERRAEIGLAALYSWLHEFQFLEFSSFISRTGVTCLCPKPRLLSGWILPLKPFSYSMWAGQLIAFFGIFITITVIRIAMINAKYKNEELDIAATWLQTWATFLQQPVNFATKHLPEMIMGIFALFTCLLIANAYSGGLSSIMTVPRYEAPIDTAHQLAEKKMIWGGTNIAWTFSLLDAPEPDLQKLVKTFEAMSFEELNARTVTGDMCYGIERLPYGHYAVGEYVDENALNYLQLMNHDLYFEYCVAMFYKTWPLKTLFDSLVLHVFESGIQKFWELQTVTRHGNSKIQLGISISRHRDRTELVKISLDHVSGTFMLWGIGIALSTIVFMIETVHYRCMKIKTKNSSKDIENFATQHN